MVFEDAMRILTAFERHDVAYVLVGSTDVECGTEDLSARRASLSFRDGRPRATRSMGALFEVLKNLHGQYGATRCRTPRMRQANGLYWSGENLAGTS